MENAIIDFITAAGPWITMGLILAIYFVICDNRKRKGIKSENYGLVGMLFGTAIGVSISHTYGMAIGMLAGLLIGTCIEKKKETD